MTKYKLSELKDLLFNANYILKVLKVTQLTLSVVLETELQPTLNTALSRPAKLRVKYSVYEKKSGVLVEGS